jgi:hypothetical protein
MGCASSKKLDSVPDDTRKFVTPPPGLGHNPSVAVAIGGKVPSSSSERSQTRGARPRRRRPSKSSKSSKSRRRKNSSNVQDLDESYHSESVSVEQQYPKLKSGASLNSCTSYDWDDVKQPKSFLASRTPLTPHNEIPEESDGQFGVGMDIIPPPPPLSLRPESIDEGVTEQTNNKREPSKRRGSDRRRRPSKSRGPRERSNSDKSRSNPSSCRHDDVDRGDNNSVVARTRRKLAPPPLPPRKGSSASASSRLDSPMSRSRERVAAAMERTSSGSSMSCGSFPNSPATSPTKSRRVYQPVSSPRMENDHRLVNRTPSSSSSINGNSRFKFGKSSMERKPQSWKNKRHPHLNPSPTNVSNTHIVTSFSPSF